MIPSKTELAVSLRLLAEQIDRMANVIRLVGGFNKRYLQHAGEMAGAANIARSWADEIEKEADE